MNNKETPYRGRFAPSPSGALHFGSLVAATGSYLQARHQQGEWYVRIDDIDPPREVPGAAEQILHDLEAYGFEWDGDVSYQSHRQECYQHALEKLQSLELVYPCSCTRRTLSEHLDPEHPDIYPGICRQGLSQGQTGHSLRVRCQSANVQFHDRLLGEQYIDMETQCGDFIIKRTDGLIAYQLATAVDDANQGITEVVRGADLLDSTFRQIYLQQLLSLSSPGYAHLPIATNHDGEKLSKNTHATSIGQLPVIDTLYQALVFLGQQPPSEMQHATLNELWRWAIQHWQFNAIPHHQKIQHE